MIICNKNIFPVLNDPPLEIVSHEFMYIESDNPRLTIDLFLQAVDI